jgi:hypothetical protein
LTLRRSGQRPRRRNMNFQTLDVDMGYVPWPEEKIEIVGADGELLRESEWWRIIRRDRSHQNYAFGNATRMRENCGVKSGERDIAVEIVLKIPNHALERKWPMPS